MEKLLQIVVRGNEIRFIHDDDLAATFQVGKASTQRASHVEPDADGWKADLSPVGGPVLGPFPRRDMALRAEVDWLQENLTPTPKH